ncbi:MAG: SpaA isopeptide-forming pilin-related protein [Clostridium sp.]
MKFVTKDGLTTSPENWSLGGYTFTEASAPSGYQLAKPVQLTIKDTGKADSDR